MSVYVLPSFTPAQRERLRAAAGPVPVLFAEDCDEEQRRAAFRAATAIVGEPRPETLADAPNLRWIQMTWAGADLYTKAPWFPDNVLVSCATGAFGGVIAEYILGVVLLRLRHLDAYVRQQERGVWRPQLSGKGIEGATVLIVGAGDIGTELAKRLRPFLPRAVIGVRRTAREKPDCFDEMYTMEALPRLWGRADVVVCALPNTAETRGLLSREVLRAMKNTALLVNVGRGTLLDPDVLNAVLESGHLAGAVLDVTNPEPLPPEHPLWRREDVLITPHVAGASFGDVSETTEKIVEIVCRDLKKFLHGEQPDNLVDFATGYRSLNTAQTQK